MQMASVSAKSSAGSTSETTAATAAVKRQKKSMAAVEVGSIKMFFSKGSEQGDAGPKMPSSASQEQPASSDIYGKASEASAPSDQGGESSCPTVMKLAAGNGPAVAEISEIYTMAEKGKFDDPKFAAILGSFELTTGMVAEFDRVMQNLKATGEEFANSKPAARPKDAKTEETLSKLTQIIDSGHVDPRSPIGQKFNLTHKPTSEKGQEYKKLSRDQAAEYRLQWVQKEYAMAQEKRSFVETWRRVDVTKGRRMTLSR